MSNNPPELRYTKTHEWVREKGDILEVGITDFAQHQLSDITYIEMPELNRHYEAGEETVVVESIKAASDVHAHIAGSIAEVNAKLADTPEIINSDPFGEGWLFRMTPDSPEDFGALLSKSDYEKSLPKV